MFCFCLLFRHLGRVSWKTSSNPSTNRIQYPILYVVKITLLRLPLICSFYLLDPAILTSSIYGSMQNDGDIKIVVGDNVDKIVLDDSKDVLLEVIIRVSRQSQRPTSLLVFSAM